MTLRRSAARVAGRPKAALASPKKVPPERTIEEYDREVVANAFGIQEYAVTYEEPVPWMKPANQGTQLR